MDRFGHNFYQEDLDLTMEKHDFTKSGSISMAEFKAMLFDITNPNDAGFKLILNRSDKMEQNSTASGQ